MRKLDNYNSNNVNPPYTIYIQSSFYTIYLDPGPVENLTKTIRNESVLIRWHSPGTPNGIITSYALHYNVTIKVIHTIPGTNVTVTNITTQSQTVTTNDTMVILNGIHGNVTYSLCVTASTSIGYGDCSKPIIFVTSKLICKDPDMTWNAIF